jgi:hypothetical protein
MFADNIDCVHEMTHCVGFEHMQVRKDRDEWVKYDAAACRDVFLADQCSDAANIDPLFRQQCSNTRMKRQLINTLKLPTPFDQTSDADIENCMKEVCVYDWLRQYNKVRTSPNGAFDIRSVMMYPFDECIQPVRAKLDAAEAANLPEEGEVVHDSDLNIAIRNRLTTIDISNVNRLYDCRKVTVTRSDDNVEHDMWFHPEVTVGRVKFLIEERFGEGSVMKLNKVSASGTLTELKRDKLTVKAAGVAADSRLSFEAFKLDFSGFDTSPFSLDSLDTTPEHE